MNNILRHLTAGVIVLLGAVAFVFFCSRPDVFLAVMFSIVVCFALYIFYRIAYDWTSGWWS